MIKHKIIKTTLSALIGLSLSVAAHADGLTLTSPDLSGQLSNTQEFSGFGCSGSNISPALAWKNAPKGTKSFAVTFYDVDAPTAPLGKGGFWHWNIFNISADVNELQANAGNIEKDLAPKGSIQGVTGFGKSGYGGACPPEGDKAHAYVFTVHALKTADLGLDKNASPALVGFMLEQNTIEKSSILTYYKR